MFVDRLGILNNLNDNFNIKPVIQIIWPEPVLMEQETNPLAEETEETKETENGS